MEWGSVLKLGAFGACLMVVILIFSVFAGVSYGSFWFSIQIILVLVFFVIILVSWRAMKKIINAREP
jgi:hypothetical protein